MIDKFPWDGYSDQPHIIKDKAFKKSIYKKAALDQLLTLGTSLLLSPVLLLTSLFRQKKVHVDTQHFFAMSVNLDKEPSLSPALIEELGVETLLIRLPLWEMDKLEAYQDFVASFKGKDIMINILQDRAHIQDHALLKRDIARIFKAFPNVKQFQIGNAINRKKWAFYTIKEYLSFYQVVQDVRDESYHDRKLLGSSVIDFEYHYTIRSLFNFFPIKYDIFTSLLYVDRRGSPENKQMGFDLKRKVWLLKAIMMLSPKTSNKLYITETNWPIKNSAPYAPTSEKECVDGETYARFMVQYYLIALASGVHRVYWHQLIAPGYGLVDTREGMKKYPAFEAYKTMLSLLKGALLQESSLDTTVKFLRFKGKNNTIMIVWSEKDLPHKKGLDLYGKPFKGGKFCYFLT